MKTAQEFWSHVAVGSADACWPWTSRTARGYGNLYFRGRTQMAHRVAFELANGPIPAGLLVRHTCDNPPCCNPAHLLLGTHRDNAWDRERRNRSKSARQRLVRNRRPFREIARASYNDPVRRARVAAYRSELETLP